VLASSLLVLFLGKLAENAILGCSAGGRPHLPDLPGGRSSDHPTTRHGERHTDCEPLAKESADTRTSAKKLQSKVALFNASASVHQSLEMACSARF